MAGPNVPIDAGYDSTASEENRLDEVPQPATWPRSASDRYQPRSRLNKALDAARRSGDTGTTGWLRPVIPAPDDPFDELKLFPNGQTGPPANGSEPVVGSSRLADPWDTPQRPGTESVASEVAGFIAVDGRVGDLGEVHAPPVGGEPTSIATAPEPITPDGPTAPFGDLEAATTEAADLQSSPPPGDGAVAVETDMQLLVDLRPGRDEPSGPAAMALPATDYGLGRRWGLQWRSAAQGWVETDEGRRLWRPVVATTDRLEAWEVDTYLGVVTAEVAVSLRDPDVQHLGSALAQGREMGMTGLVEEAVERGAHGVLGVTMSYTVVEPRLLITITGTAVTLRERVRPG